MNAKSQDEIQQKFEWRARLVVDVLSRKFDIQILAEMLEAGLRQAHSEGLIDAALICDHVAEMTDRGPKRHTAEVLGRCIRELDRKNKEVEPGDYSIIQQSRKKHDRS